MTTALPQGPGTFGQRRWATLGLVLPVAIGSGLVALGSIGGVFDETLSRAGRTAVAVAIVVLIFIAVRASLVGFAVTDDYVRVRGLWATRTVKRDQVAGFVMECDPAERWHFPAVVATDGRRTRARWAFRRAGRDGSRRVAQEIVDALTRVGRYDEQRLDAALNAVDAVRRGHVVAHRWTSPAGWPVPPPAWQPPAGWAPPPDWTAPPPGWEFWQTLDVPIVVAADVAADPEEAPADPSVGHLDTRYALDLEVAKGLPGSNWGIWEAVQAFLWVGGLIALTIPIGVYGSDRLAGLLGECSIGLAVVLAGRKPAAQSGGWRRALGWDLPRPRDAWFALRWFGWNMLGRFFAGLVLLVVTLPLKGEPQSNVDVSGDDSVAAILLLIVVAVLIAPVVEEFFFRGLLLRSIMRRYSFWPAAIVSSVLFGLAHVPQVDTARARVILGGSIATFGLVQAMLARRKARLGPNMLVHGFANALVVIIAVL
ncbi:MAG: CPBP family intramembrane glutamic endopeptidase [Actinomycetes bacterium]